MKKTDAIERDYYQETGEMRHPRPLVPTVFANDLHVVRSWWSYSFKLV